MDALSPPVMATLRALGGDSLGGEVELTNHSEVENAVVMRAEESASWLAVVPVRGDGAAAATVDELKALMDPPCRVVAVGLLDRCTNLRSRGDIDFFTEAELQYNAIRHEDQPRMRRLTPEEAAGLLDVIKLEDARFLPVMTAGDIVARYYGFRAGDIVQCDRQTSSGEVSYYRCVGPSKDAREPAS